MVVELADEVVAAFDGGPAEEGVGLELHCALAFDDAAALVRRQRLLAEVGRVGGGASSLICRKSGSLAPLPCM